MRIKIILLMLILMSLISCKTNESDTISFNEKYGLYETELNEEEFLAVYKIDSILKSPTLDDIDFDTFKAGFSHLKIDGFEYYVVEGDLFFDEDQLYDYYIERFVNLDSLHFDESDSEKLIGLELNGMLIRVDNPLKITYSIVRSSFSNDMEYYQIVALMNKATNDWSRICNVRFYHIHELDDKLKPSENPSELSFVLRGYPAGGEFYAKSFYPYYVKRRRKIFIDPLFFSTKKYDKTGILRHEIGHSLGFRHEHIRSGAPSICPNGSTTGMVDHTAYDPKSVMHYFCGGVGSRALNFTKSDSIGASLVYGSSPFLKK